MAVASSTTVAAEQRSISLSKQISMLEPEMRPLIRFVAELGKEATSDKEFKWAEDDHKARFDTVNGTATDTATSIPVDHAAYFSPYDQFLVTRTGEQIHVESVDTAGGNLTVLRGIGSTAAAIIDADELLIIGSAQPEGDRSKAARRSNPSIVSNYTQIFRTPIEATGTTMASGSQLMPRAWDHDKRKAGDEHAKDVEYSFLLGHKNANTTGVQELRATGGALSFIQTNQTAAGGDLTEAEFNTAIRDGMRYGGSQKLLLASGIGVSALQKFPAAKLQVRQDESTYGINVTRFTSPFGSVYVVWHRLLEGTKYGGYIIGLEMDQIKYRYLGDHGESRDTKLNTEIQENDLDGRKDEFLSEIGLEFGQEKTHFVISGITS